LQNVAVQRGARLASSMSSGFRLPRNRIGVRSVCA
jgi:hypothetical protein